MKWAAPLLWIVGLLLLSSRMMAPATVPDAPDRPLAVTCEQRMAMAYQATQICWKNSEQGPRTYEIVERCYIPVKIAAMCK